jgi:prepilin-type N-terminal cleavage/methylation domain-containing protein
MGFRKNQGFTLVELLVSIAVLSIVTLGVGGLLRLAADQYSNATKETEVQNLIQSTFASINNALVDTEIGVDFVEWDSKSALVIANKNSIVVFLRIGDKLYYTDALTYSSDVDESGKLADAVTKAKTNFTPTDAENLLADHVAEFNVDKTHVANGWVVLSVKIQHHERYKSMSQNVFLRNLSKTGVVTFISASEAEEGDDE